MNICLVLHKYDVPLDDPCCYPLGYMYVASVLKKQGHNVKVLNYNLWDYDFEEEIKDQDAVGFTGFEEFADNILRDAAICRERGIYTVLGGALATFVPEIMLGIVDQVCVGEFEETSNIDIIPWPDYESFGIEEYHKRHSRRYMGILTSRGCPYSCTFCAQTCMYGQRSLPMVYGEIAYYKSKYNIDTIMINDNTLNVSKPRFMRLCEALRKLNITWTGSIRCDLMDEDMIKAAKESNCEYLIVGVESFRQEKLNKMNKMMKVEDIYKTLELLHKYKIKYHGNILVGFDYEDYQDICLEVSMIPPKYNVFPALVQPFIGTGEGYIRHLTKDQTSYLDKLFTNYIHSNGMYTYSQMS